MIAEVDCSGSSWNWSLSVMPTRVGSMSAKSLQRKPLVIREGEPVPDERVEITTRIGITRSADWPLRWIVKGNKYVSKGKVSA